MDVLNPDVITAAVVAAGVLGGGTLAVLVAKRARAVRRREIEAAGEPSPAVEAEAPKGALPPGARTVTPLPDADGDGPAAVTREVPVTAPTPKPAAPERREARPPGQVLPFPGPGERAAVSPTAVPVDKPRAEPSAPAPAAPKKKDAAALVPGLARTRSGWVAKLGQIFSGKQELDPSMLEEIEKVLLTADIGVKTSSKLIEELRSSLSRKDIRNPDAVWAFLRERSAGILGIDAPPIDFRARKPANGPFVVLVIGVNGSGKTTTIGKLAAKLRDDGLSVMLAAGDTFRAAAAEQLEVWGARTGTPVVRGKEGADPSSVVFEAVKRANAEGVDVVIADTAGRLHTKTELMAELQKVRRVIGKAQEGAPHETWLVLDSTSGQNAIAQAQIFTEALSVSGIVLTKLDGTAKGGVILGICDQLKIPVRWIGVGERVEDLRPFDAEEFVEALYAEGATSTVGLN